MSLDDWKAPDGGTLTRMPDGTPRNLADIQVQARLRSNDLADDHLKFKIDHIKAKAASAQALDNGMLAIFLSFVLTPFVVVFVCWLAS